jgi:hypothetical protein
MTSGRPRNVHPGSAGRGMLLRLHSSWDENLAKASGLQKLRGNVKRHCWARLTRFCSRMDRPLDPLCTQPNWSLCQLGPSELRTAATDCELTCTTATVAAPLTTALEGDTVGPFVCEARRHPETT